MRNFLDNSIVIHKSKPPLRWIVNWMGSRACNAVMRSAWLDEYGIDKGIRHTINEFIFKIFWPPYKKYGTFYKIDTNMTGAGWDDYDQNNHPYWDYDWHEDDEYGSNWRLIK